MVSSHPDRFSSFYPTAAEPEFVPTEPSITPDDQILVDELRRRGHQVAAVVWGCLVEDLRNQFDLLVVRSTWDYMDSAESRRQFLTWLSALEQAGVVVPWECPSYRRMLSARGNHFHSLSISIDMDR
jgi:hypothetical protein